MDGLLNGPGFLGTNAPFHSDLALILIFVTVIQLTLGWRLARQKRYAAHRWMQTSAVILNTLVVLFAMIGSFLIHILPGIPGKLNEGDYAVSTVHALIGLVGLGLGVFIVLRGNNWVPEALRFKNYKLFMRTSYALYLAGAFLGLIVYLLVYVYGV